MTSHPPSTTETDDPSPSMATYYHVTRLSYDGGDLLSLAARSESMGHNWAMRRALFWLARNYGGLSILRDPRSRMMDEAERYLAGDGSLVSLHVTLADAEEFRAEFGGATIVAVQLADTDLVVRNNEGYPAVRGRIPAARCTPQF